MYSETLPLFAPPYRKELVPYRVCLFVASSIDLATYGRPISTRAEGHFSNCPSIIRKRRTLVPDEEMRRVFRNEKLPT